MDYSFVRQNFPRVKEIVNDWMNVDPPKPNIIIGHQSLKLPKLDQIWSEWETTTSSLYIVPYQLIGLRPRYKKELEKLRSSNVYISPEYDLIRSFAGEYAQHALSHVPKSNHTEESKPAYKSSLPFDIKFKGIEAHIPLARDKAVNMFLRNKVANEMKHPDDYKVENSLVHAIYGDYFRQAVHRLDSKRAFNRGITLLAYNLAQEKFARMSKEEFRAFVRVNSISSTDIVETAAILESFLI